jgi:hypothetical protein
MEHTFTSASPLTLGSIWSLFPFLNLYLHSSPFNISVLPTSFLRRSIGLQGYSCSQVFTADRDLSLSPRLLFRSFDILTIVDWNKATEPDPPFNPPVTCLRCKQPFPVMA